MARVASEYEAKRISEAEQKRAQRKARAKASTTELSSSDLSCSSCNRQFRAKIGHISHLRTHKLTLHASDQDWSLSVMTDEGKSSLFLLRFYGPVNPMGSCRAFSLPNHTFTGQA